MPVGSMYSGKILIDSLDTQVPTAKNTVYLAIGPTAVIRSINNNSNSTKNICHSIKKHNHSRKKACHCTEMIAINYGKVSIYYAMKLIIYGKIIIIEIFYVFTGQ